MSGGPRRGNLVRDEASFWSKVERTEEGCWRWLGTSDKRGYGRTGFGKYSAALAHRVSWQIHNGPIPDGLHVCHKCDNPPCCNPEHLFLGTDADNMRDMRQKGRGSTPPVHRGADHHGATLPDEVVREARESYAAGRESQRQIARRLGIESSTVSTWIRGAVRVEAGGTITPSTPLPTHCSKGHEFTPENTYRTERKPARTCWTCMRDRARARSRRVQLEKVLARTADRDLALRNTSLGGER